MRYLPNQPLKVAGMSLILFAASCASTEGPRDPRMDRANIYAAASNTDGYTQFVDKLRMDAAAAVRRERASRERNLVLTSDLSEAQAREQALKEELQSLQAEIGSLNELSEQAQSQSGTERDKIAALNARRDALTAKANDIASTPQVDMSALEAELTELEAERRVLVSEYESLI